MAAQVLRFNPSPKQNKKKLSTLKPDLKKIYISNKGASLLRTFIHSKEKYSCQTRVLNFVESQR